MSLMNVIIYFTLLTTPYVSCLRLATSIEENPEKSVTTMAFDGETWVVREVGRKIDDQQLNMAKKPKGEVRTPATVPWLPSYDVDPLPYHSTADCQTIPTANPQMYSQSGEDRDLYNNFFCGKRDGTFVELGALDGLTYSNTKFFEDTMGWSGALIEATPTSGEKLTKNRENPRNKIFREGVCKEGQSTMDFLIASSDGRGKNGATNGDPNNMADTFKKKWHNANSQTITVPCRPLGDFIKEFLEHSGRDHIDLLSLDVEGGELAVLSTFTFEVPVNIFMVEMDHHNPQKNEGVREILRAHGYHKSNKQFDKRNEVWVTKDIA